MPDGNNLTIDFSDASFDNDSITEPNIANVDLDVVFPLDDSPITVGSGAHERPVLILIVYHKQLRQHQLH